MKLVKVEPFSKAAPGFNKAKAEEVYKAIMACPDDESAAVMARAIVFDGMVRDINLHGEFLAKAYDEELRKRAETVKATLAKQLVAKRLKGEDLSEITRAIKYTSELSKAYDPYERSRNAQRQRRSHAGRFVAEHKSIGYDKAKPIDNRVFDRLYGITTPSHHKTKNGPGKPLTAHEQRNWQIAYQEALDTVAPYSHHPGARVHFTYPGNGGHEEVNPKDFIERGEGIRTGARPHAVAVSINDHYVTPAGAEAFYGMLGDSPRAARMQSNLAGTNQQWSQSGLNPERLGRFNDAAAVDQGAYPNQPGARLFSRLSAGSALIDQSLGDNAPNKVRQALAAGQWVGEYGPEAQRVIGPTAQKTAYRYRGVEKKPDHALGQAFARINMRMPNADIAERARAVIDPTVDDQGKEHASPVIQYFKNRLPKANLNTLQTASGTIPPSEGIVLDKHGKVVTQAVGYGDDWYLPFNLKNVGRMRGGSYIRTRTFGGPTTEDVYTALMSGARSLTVISHSGVYTVEFDKSFKGGRRYNDKAARMVSRYGQLLDAVKSEQVELDLMDPARRQEIRATAARNVRDPDNPDMLHAEERRLVRAEAIHPKLSEQRKTELAATVVDEAARGVKTNNGLELTGEQYRQHLVVQNLKRNEMYDVLDDDQRRDWARKELDGMTDQKIISSDPKLKEKYDKLEASELAKTRRELEPLKLNGAGYDLALQGLREQFPYYIHEPVYRPWADASNKKDTGYVKPRHIRPEGASIGYFDPTIDGGPGSTGTGKITADTQWAPPGMARTPTQIKARIAERQQQAERAAVGSPGYSGGSGGGAPAAARAAAGGPLVAAQADADLAKHLVDLANNGNFREGAKVGDETLSGSVAGADWLRKPGGAGELAKLTAITSMSPDEIDMQSAEPGFQSKLAAALGEAQRLFNVDSKLLEAHRLRGAVPAAKAVPQNPSEMLLRPNDEYQLGHMYEPGRHTKSEVVDEFESHQGIQDLGLPHITDDKFDSALDQKVAETRRKLVDIQRDNSGQYSEAEKRDAEREAENVIRAKHLSRRLKKARPDEVVNEDMVIATPEDIARSGMSPEAAAKAHAALGSSPAAIENMNPEIYAPGAKENERKEGNYRKEDGRWVPN